MESAWFSRPPQNWPALQTMQCNLLNLKQPASSVGQSNSLYCTAGKLHGSHFIVIICVCAIRLFPCFASCLFTVSSSRCMLGLAEWVGEHNYTRLFKCHSNAMAFEQPHHVLQFSLEWWASKFMRPRKVNFPSELELIFAQFLQLLKHANSKYKMANMCPTTLIPVSLWLFVQRTQALKLKLKQERCAHTCNLGLV